MRACVTTPLAGVSPERVIAALHEPQTWSNWLTGVRLERILNEADEGSELRLIVDGPRQFQVDVMLVKKNRGIQFSLLEGPLRHLGGFIVLSEDSEELNWQVHFSGLTTIPTALGNELAERVIPRWGDSLMQTVQS